MPLSVQLYSVREAIDADATDALGRLRTLGLDTVELFGLLELQDRYQVALEATGMRAPSAHEHLLEDADPEAVFSAAVRLGVETVIEPAVREGWESREGVAAMAHRLNDLGRRAADHGLRVGYHNHWWEFADLNGRTAFEVFADLLDPAVVLELDVYWAEVAGVAAPALLDRLGERVRFLHVKDGPLPRDGDVQLPAGEGAVDIPAVLAASPHTLRVIEFDHYAGDVFEGIGASIAYLNATEETA
ncbi:sugar phosphate isomerase/epimerase family protein [Glycomyces harbinensis]|uniref:Sugar phosphate isomerase/epimerase n=1 Tax=Glycomyces harbinensis TaxID=58114 RepID=A0A1G6ZK30_9ACTN|nr:sugar phosphate isomerase/epimerase [Glycomyces harbinensis]SDE03114.1 Sugar phosphate isomerase/epimerase [Glycomyces harbinensis]